MAPRMMLVSLLVLGAGVPAGASEPVSFACHAEVTPRVVSAGAAGQSFSLTVTNGRIVPVPVDVAQVDLLRVQAPYDLREWPPAAIVIPTSAPAPSPWASRIAGSPPMIVYEGGRMPLGGGETFSITADVANETGTFDWIVEASRDEGQTLQGCQPAFNGALDLTVT